MAGPDDGLRSLRERLRRELASRVPERARRWVRAALRRPAPQEDPARAARERVRSSGLFDEAWYLARNPDVAAAGVDPVEHFLAYGATEGRWPHPSFDPLYYLRAHPDVAAAGLNPLLHYVDYGRAEGRATSAVAEQQPDTALAPRIEPAQQRRRRTAEEIARLGTEPLVSVLVPTFDTDPALLALAVASVEAQSYPHWELIVSDDGSTSPATHRALDALAQRDPRIRVQRHPANRGISAATNAALEQARGAWIALLDHDDELHPDALAALVEAIQSDPLLDAVYTDQDFIETDGTVAEPFLKPDWSPDLFRGVMYVGHLLAVRRTTAQDAGSFDARFDGVQDFEFMLRVAERARRIGHVPEVLYHWRRVPGSVASDTHAKGKGITELQARAVTAHLARSGIPAVAKPHPRHAHRVVVQPTAPTVREIVRVRPTPGEPGHRGGPLRVPAATGGGEPLFLFMDDDLAPAAPDWLDLLALYASLPGIGCVAPVIADREGHVLEAGWVLGMDGPVGPVMRGMDADGDGYAGSLACAREVTVVSGRCALVSSAVLAKLGGLRDGFATPTYQIADLALRAHVAGYRNLVVPAARRVAANDRPGDEGALALDRALLGDAFARVIARGDPYHHAAFVRASPGYVVDPSGGRRSPTRAKS